MDTELMPGSSEQKAIELVAAVIGRNMGLPTSRVLRAAKEGTLLGAANEFYRRELNPARKGAGVEQ